MSLEQEHTYHEAMLEMVSMIRRVSEYLRDPSVAERVSPEEYEGMKQAYFRVMSGIVSQIKANEDLSMKDMGLEGYDPASILYYVHPLAPPSRKNDR